MRSLTAITLFLAGLCAAPAPAQGPYADYNRDRAYRHFLYSQSPHRTFSSLGTGAAWGYETPFESAYFWRTPGYYREEISPYGRGVYEVPPQEGGYVAPRPLFVYPPPYYPAYPPPYYP